MNILQVVDLAEANVIDSPAIDTNELKDLDSFVQHNRKVKSMFKDGVKFSNQVEIVKEVKNCLEPVIIKVNAPELPVAKLSSMRSLCDTFGFIMIPYECYNNEHFFDKDSVYSEDIKKTVENIVAKNVTNSKFYVVTPIGNYDIRAHVMYNGNKQLYLGQHATLLGGVMLQIPLFRELFGRMEAAENNIVSLDKQIQSINDEIARMKDEQMRQKMETLQMFEAAKRMRRAEDPILLSVDTDNVATETGDVLCSIHYQWGPDFTDEVAEVLNLEVKKHQSEKCFSMFKDVYTDERLELLPEDDKLVKMIDGKLDKISQDIVKILNTQSLSFLHEKYWNIFHNTNPTIDMLQKVYSECVDNKFKQKALNLMLWR